MEALYLAINPNRPLKMRTASPYFIAAGDTSPSSTLAWEISRATAAPVNVKIPFKKDKDAGAMCLAVCVNVAAAAYCSGDGGGDVVQYMSSQRKEILI